MSPGMNELAEALRKLQPAPVDAGRMLFEAGVARGARRVRFWQAASVIASTAAVAFALIGLKPAGEVKVPLDSSGGTKAIEQPRKSPAPGREVDLPSEDPLPAWRLQQHQVHLDPARPADAADEGEDDARLLRAGDIQRGLSPWLAVHAGEQQ